MNNIDRFLEGVKTHREIYDSVEATGASVEDIVYDLDGNVIVYIDGSTNELEADIGDLIDFQLPDDLVDDDND